MVITPTVMRSLLLVLLFSVVSSSVLRAQQLDNTFHSAIPFRAAYTSCQVKLPDGNILLGGNIDYYNNTPVHDLIRIHPDGSRDATFSFAGQSGYYVHDLALRDNGEIVVLLKAFNSYNSDIFSASKVLVLYKDGLLKVGLETNPDATTIAVQNDGKILVGGSTATGGYAIRYNQDLSPDNAFNNTLSVDGWVTDIKVAGDKLFLAGIIHKVNGVTKNNIVKLNLDGTLDNSFDTGSGTSDFVGAVTVAPDGKILPGMTYINSFNGQQRRGTVRLNADGSVDDTFGVVSLNGMMSEPLVTPEGIYFFSFIEWKDVYGTYLMRITDAGAMDPDFEPVLLSMEQSLAYPTLLPVGDHFIVTGAVVEGNPYQVSWVDKTGVVDPAFAPRISRTGVVRFGDEQNGKIIVGGDFVRIDSVNTFGMARLNNDGTVDDSFVADENFGVVAQMQLFDDETALVSTNKYFFKLDSQGKVKPDFNWTPGGFLYQVNRFRVLGDDKIIVGDPNTIARLNPDGSVDGSFYMGHSSSSTAFSFDMQGDSIIYGFTVWTGGDEFTTKVQRITPNAVVDTTFRVKNGPGVADVTNWTSVTMVKVLDNKEILIGGYFDTFDGLPVAHGLVKLSRDGKIDQAFNANQSNTSGPQGFFDPQVEQIGSKVYIRGNYSIYVINLDGTVDAWTIPVTVEGLSGIVASSSQEGSSSGRAKSDDSYIIALGSFQPAESDKHLSILKIKITQEPEEPNTVTGVEPKHESLELEIYPQPTTGILNVRFDDTRTGFRAAVYNSSGLKMLEKNYAAQPGSDATTLDVSQIPPGFYTLKVLSNSGKLGYSKFIRVP